MCGVGVYLSISVYFYILFPRVGWVECGGGGVEIFMEVPWSLLASMKSCKLLSDHCSGQELPCHDGLVHLEVCGRGDLIM